MNIRPITFIDTSTLVYGFIHRKRAPRLLDADTLEGWRAMRTVISQIRNGASGMMNGHVAEVANVEIEVLGAMEHQDWWSEPDADYVRLHLPLIPSPSAVLYCGGEAAAPPVGQLTFVSPRVLNSAVNFGSTPRVHLIVDLMVKPEDPIDDPDL